MFSKLHINLCRLRINMRKSATPPAEPLTSHALEGCASAPFFTGACVLLVEEDSHVFPISAYVGDDPFTPRSPMLDPVVNLHRDHPAKMV
jgi:hypothetical protein